MKPLGDDGRAEPPPARDEGLSKAGGGSIWEQVFERENLYAALKRVESKGGAPGIDGMTVQELRVWLKEHWLEVRAALDGETYQPSPVRRVEIAKPGGGVRLLGIPTVLDRFIQQAIAQVMGPLFEPKFSPHSYGFRPGRRAHDAVKAAQGYIREGYTWVVDVDLEKFFLDDLDRELEKRGQRFVRYADDCNIYVKSERAGQRVMSSVQRFVEQELSLKVNEQKSAVDRPWRRKFLGFSFYRRNGEVHVRLAQQTKDRMRKKLRRLTKRTRSGKLAEIIQEINQYTLGWIGYFRLAETPSVCQELDEWLRRRLRQLVWKRWKRGKTRYRELVALGVPASRAALGAVGKSPWRMSRSPVVNQALNNAYWQKLGLKSIEERYRQLSCA